MRKGLVRYLFTFAIMFITPVFAYWLAVDNLIAYNPNVKGELGIREVLPNTELESWRFSDVLTLSEGTFRYRMNMHIQGSFSSVFAPITLINLQPLSISCGDESVIDVRHISRKKADLIINQIEDGKCVITIIKTERSPMGEDFNNYEVANVSSVYLIPDTLTKWIVFIGVLLSWNGAILLLLSTYHSLTRIPSKNF